MEDQTAGKAPLGECQKNGVASGLNADVGKDILDSAGLSAVHPSPDDIPHMQETFDCIGEVCDHRGIWDWSKYFGRTSKATSSTTFSELLSSAAGGVALFGFIAGFWQKLAHHPASSLELLLIPVMGLVVMCAAAIYFAYDKTPRMRIEVSTTSGPSTSLCLSVTNRGKPTNFSAFCDIIGHSNGDNDFRRGEYRCGWDNGKKRRVFIQTNETDNIVIASFRDVIPFDFSELILWEVIADDSVPRESVRWQQHPNETLPGFDLRIRIVGENTMAPQTFFYTVKPFRFTGPLEMLPTEVMV